MLHSLFKTGSLFLACLCGLSHAQSTHDECFQKAGTKYQLDHRLLKAIGLTESSLRTNAHNVDNANKSEDFGIMQINSIWLPQLKKWGITKETLLTDACTNIHVGAWVLAQNVRRLGTTWNAVGAYNASSTHKRQGYVDKVWRNYARLVALEDGVKPIPVTPTAPTTPSPKLRII